jgi:hypothetical protein
VLFRNRFNLLNTYFSGALPVCVILWRFCCLLLAFAGADAFLGVHRAVAVPSAVSAAVGSLHCSTQATELSRLAANMNATMKAVFTGAELTGAVQLAQRLDAAGFELATLNSVSTHSTFEAAGVKHSDTPQQAGVADLLSDEKGHVAVLVAGLGSIVDGSVDIGTHALVRAATVQHERCVVVVDAADFDWLGGAVSAPGDIAASAQKRRGLAAKALRATSAVDAQLAESLCAVGEEVS